MTGDIGVLRRKSTETVSAVVGFRQYTFQEAKILCQALAAGPSFRGWDFLEGDVALRYGLEGKAHEVKLTPSPRLVQSMGGVLTSDKLKAELARVDLRAVLLLQALLGIVIDQGECLVPLDDLLRKVGFQPRSRPDRAVQRCQVWRWLLLIESSEILGERRGRYWNRDTNAARDLMISGPLLQIADARYQTPTAGDPRTAPDEVFFIASEWLAALKGAGEVLSHFGDLERIASLPSGRPSGAWAQSIALALHQRWRERAAQHGMPQRFTRRYLLDLFPARPELDDVLRSANPSRAKEYWSQAIGLLRVDQGGIGLIDTYREVGNLAADRQGWQTAWLQQPLEIEPSERLREALAEIRVGAERHGNRRGRRPLQTG